MVKIVECDTVGESLTGWAEAADQPAKDALCEALDCSGGGGGGDLCEQIEALDVATGFGDDAHLVVQGPDGCKRVRVDPAGIFTDVRAMTQATPHQVLVGNSTAIKFTARNVSSVSIGNVQIVATLPVLTDGDPEYTISAAIVSSGTSVATPVDESTSIKVWDIDTLPAGGSVSITYTLTPLKPGPITASTLVDIIDDTVVDFDDQDDYHAIVITASLTETPPTPECPAMGIEVDGVRTPLLQAGPAGEVSVSMTPYRLASALNIARSSTVVITSAVPAFAILDASLTSVGKQFYNATEGKGYVSAPTHSGARPPSGFENATPALDFTGDGQTFTLTNNGAAGRFATIAVRPSEDCRWQSFMVFVPGTDTWQKGELNVTTGTPPPLVKADVLPSAVVVADSPQGDSYHTAGLIGQESVVPREHLTFNIPSVGGPYTFTVTSTDQALSTNWNSTGVVDLSVPNSTTAEITINPGTPANNFTLGDFTFNFA